MIKFVISGHKNIRSAHKTTLEFTKENELTLRGDCILGIKADFDSSEVIEFAKLGKKVKITIKSDNYEDEVIAYLNPAFKHREEIVIRKSEFICDRTFAVNADKSAVDINRDLVDKLKECSKADVIISLFE